jgi:hypothetical protein
MAVPFYFQVMVASLQLFIFILAIIFLLNLLIGLFQPVLVLWFLDRFNRLKVIKIYGTLFIFSLLLWLGIVYFFSNPSGYLPLCYYR